MRRIKLNEDVGKWKTGEVVSADEDIAAALIKQGYADEVGKNFRTKKRKLKDDGSI